ncbi:MAG: insulinase family protein [Parachlamydiales bacterium]|jgi:zinc protease
MKNTVVFLSLISALLLCLALLLGYYFFTDPCQGQCSIPPIKDEAPLPAISKAAFVTKSYTLPNGIKLFVLPTTFEPDEVSVRVIASRGYADESPRARASAELAIEMAWESGVNGKTSDQISATLYAEGIELTSKVYPFFTVMEATLPTEKMDKFFTLASTFIQNAHITSKGSDAIKQKIWKNLEEKADARTVDLDDLLKEQLYPALPQLQSLRLSDLQILNPHDANIFLRKTISNPKNYTIVVVGDIEPETAYQLLKEHLGQWKPLAQINASEFEVPSQESLPIKGQTQKSFNLHQKGDGFTKLVFPLKITVTQESIRTIDFLANLVEERLRTLLKEKTGSYQGIDVSYEFPLYPHLTPVVLSIQYRSAFNINQEIIELILKNLRELTTKGPSKEEYEMVNLYLGQADEYWRKNNEYWLEMLSNYGLWNWPVNDLTSDVTLQVNEKDVNEMIFNVFDINDYLMLSSSLAP